MILNLINKQESTLPYELVKYPDKHPHVNLVNKSATGDYVQDHTAITIKVRLDTMDNVFLLRQAVRQIRNMNADIKITVYITYLMCARYDRPMSQYDSCDLELVADDINNLNLHRVIIAEPHSSVSLSLIKQAVAAHPLDVEVAAIIKRYNVNEVCIVPPDLGAVKRVETFLGSIQQDIPVVYMNKHRILSTGVITGIDIFNPINLRPTVIIYDDLCDGGRTFTEAAIKLRATGVVEHIILAVTHGIFSKGIVPLLNIHAEHGAYLDEIVTTDSYKDQGTGNRLTVIKI